MNKHHTYYLNCEEAPKQIYIHKYYMNGALPSGKTDWKGKPADWSDIRKDCPENSIALYVAHPADYSAYDNLGFTATCIGGYNVFIDGVQYGTTYASNAQCDITWSTSGITTGDDITTPSALKAHKIWIEPATSGNNITAFHCARVATSGTEEQGVLWAHFNIDNEISLQDGFCSLYDPQYRNTLLEAITAKNNKILFSNIFEVVALCSSLEYTPVFIGNNLSYSSYGAFRSTPIKNVTLKNATITGGELFYNCTNLEKIKGNVVIVPSSGIFNNNYSLEELPEIDASSATNMTDFLTNATALNDTVLDVSAATGLTKIGCYGTSTYFMLGFKGLRVSNQAPFDSATAPQINVSYTGIDRSALVQLFEDLPTVTGGQIINITDTVGANNLTGADMEIAINKGWTITGSRDYVIENGILTWANPKLYLQSDNNSYINTGVKSSSSLKAEILFKRIAGSNLFGYYGTSGGVNKGFLIAGLNTTYFLRIGAGTASGSSGFVSNGYNTAIIANDFDTCKVNNQPITTNNGLGNYTFSDGGDIYLFNINGNMVSTNSINICYAKIYDNDILIRHFVPVPSGLVIGDFTCPSEGMFDIVNQQFYGNAGTGSFSYGKDS